MVEHARLIAVGIVVFGTYITLMFALAVFMGWGNDDDWPGPDDALA